MGGPQFDCPPLTSTNEKAADRQRPFLSVFWCRLSISFFPDPTLRVCVLEVSNICIIDAQPATKSSATKKEVIEPEFNTDPCLVQIRHRHDDRCHHGNHHPHRHRPLACLRRV